MSQHHDKLNKLRSPQETLELVFHPSFFIIFIFIHSFPLATPTRPQRPLPSIIRRNRSAPTSRNRQRTIHRLVNIRLIAILLPYINITHTLTCTQIRACAPQRSLRRISSRTERQRVRNIPGSEIIRVADDVDVLPEVCCGVHIEDYVDLTC